MRTKVLEKTLRKFKVYETKFLQIVFLESIPKNVKIMSFKVLINFTYVNYSTL